MRCQFERDLAGVADRNGLSLKESIAAIAYRLVHADISDQLSVLRIVYLHLRTPVESVGHIDRTARVYKALLNIGTLYREGEFDVEFLFLVEIELDHLDLVRHRSRDHPHVSVKASRESDEMSKK